MPDRTESLWRLLPGVRTQERPRFLFFAGLATLISLAQTLGLAGTEALFLARYGAALLPITFIAAALFTVLGSMVYAARVGTERNDGLFVRMLLLAAAALAGSAAALQYGFDPVLPILFCLFYLTQALFVNHLWTFSGDFFDTVASKRLVPLFTIGGSVGGVIGGLAVVGATEFVGPVSLIFAWSALLAASAVLVVAMRGQLLRWGALDADEADETSVEGIQAAMRYLGTSALGRWLSVSAMAMMLSLFVLQYIYSDVFARTFPDSSDLAAFFGIYLAATNVIEILVEVRVTPWLISRVGVPITNLLHPVLTIASFGGLAIGTGMPAAAAARINRELLDNSLSGPVRALLYNAMPRRYRGRTRAFLEGIIVYAGMALAGMVLLALDAPDRHWLSVAGGAMAVLYLGANLRVRHEYFRTLVTELRAGRLDLEDLGEEVGQGAVESLSHVWEQLLREEGNNPSSTVLQFIPSLAERGLVRPLIRAASHPNADVRRSCINALRGSDVEEAAAMLLVALEDDDAKVRLAALRALTRDRASSRPIEPLIKRLLDDPDSPVRAEAAVHAGEAGERVLAEMIRSQDRSIAFAALKIAPASALEHVATRLTDDDPAIRAAALESHARAGVPPAEPDELLAIAEDPDPAIRRAGVMLLANVDDPSARAMLAGALADSSAPVRFAAETVLGSLGEAGIEAVEPLLRAPRERAVLSALRVIARSRTP
ncbi:MAG: HEAT repeat domain-containing protein, partial [Myxococcota bacterium]